MEVKGEAEEAGRPAVRPRRPVRPQNAGCGDSTPAASPLISFCSLQQLSIKSHRWTAEGNTAEMVLWEPNNVLKLHVHSHLLI